MDIVTIAIWIALILTGLGIAIIAVFSIISIANGKVRLSSLLAAVVPLAVFGLSYALSAGGPDPLTQAAVLSAIILVVAGLVGILITGLRGLIG